MQKVSLYIRNHSTRRYEKVKPKTPYPMGTIFVLRYGGKRETLVSSQDRDDLDYGASPDQPDIDKTGCGYRDLTPIQPASDLIHAQQEADLGNRDWVFDDPQHVASDAIARFAKIEEASIAGLKETRKAQGRVVYEWRPSKKAETYMVVVSRPYWLSLYSHDPKRVAWVVAAAYVSSCGKNNSVTGIK
jgi:hypothetical protein